MPTRSKISKLPPYSTYPHRIANKTQIYVPQTLSTGNILTFTPRGFNHELNVKFPDGRLAVCEKCKKNYKTRETCRVRGQHNTAPWTTAYICVTLDDSCTDDEGKFVDKPLTVRMSNWKPFSMKKDFDEKTPVCASCKKTNRTRTFCRERHKHRHLPWSTVYVILSAVDSTDPSTVVASPSRKKFEQSPTPAANAKIKAPEGGKEKEDSEKDDNTNDDTDDINAIEPSRTFLALYSCRSSSIFWLEHTEGESTSIPTESEVKALNDAIRNPDIHSDMHPIGIGRPYYQMMTPQQQHQYLQQQYAWHHAHYGQNIMMMPNPFMQMAAVAEAQQDMEHNDTHMNGVVDFPTHDGTDEETHNPTSPDAQAQLHAQMMFQQHMYHQHYLSHQQYMAQHASQQFMAEYHDPNATNDELHNIELEDLNERDSKRQRIESIDPGSFGPDGNISEGGF